MACFIVQNTHMVAFGRNQKLNQDQTESFFSLCEITYNLRYPGPRGKFTFEITVPPNALGYLPAHIVFKHLTTRASNSLASGLKDPKESIYLNYRDYKNEKPL